MSKKNNKRSNKNSNKNSKNTIRNKASRAYTTTTAADRASGVRLNGMTGATGMTGLDGLASIGGGVDTMGTMPPVNPIPMPVVDGTELPVVDGAPMLPGVDGVVLSVPINGNSQNEKYIWLNNAALQISPDIQRKLSPMRVSEILKKYSPLVANPVKVSYRDGKYYIFDGMHTRAAMCGLNGTDNFPIFCRVYYGLTKEDEARLFATQFGVSEAVPMGYRLRALAVAKDPEVLEFIKVTENSGFAITPGSTACHNGRISAVCQAFKVYLDLGSVDYGRMLKMLHRTWAGERWSVSRYMIGGMGRFMKMYKVRANSFVKAFREVRQEDIEKEAMRFVSMSKDGAYATALAEIYDCKTGHGLVER